jgi:hypothetical protein
MAPAVEQAMIGEDAVGSDQIFYQLRVRRSGRDRRRLGSGKACDARSGQRQQNHAPAATRVQLDAHDKLQCRTGAMA